MTQSDSFQSNGNSPRVRRAFLLPIVLIAVATLALAVSVFAEQMLAEYRVTHYKAAQFQAVSAAHSGVEYLLHSADQARYRQQGLLNLPASAWARQSLHGDSRAAFFFIADHVRSSVDPTIGLRNESGKLNLNGLPTDESNIELVRWRLMALPKMTPQIADSIMDWIDSDEVPRPLGAESTWYSAQRADRLPAQRPIKSLRELLLVRDVTQELLFGEDTNGNGWLDECENDGATTFPPDNADGVLDRGWSQYLTVWSAESNYRDQQQLKIHINQTDLAQLYDQLVPLLGVPATKFIVALRLEGPRQRGNVSRASDAMEQEERLRTAKDRLRQQLDVTAKTNVVRPPQVRGGLELGTEPSYLIRSMADLVDQEVLTLIDNQQQLLRSPWEASQVEMALAKLEAICSVNAGPVVLSRINLDAAPLAVLKTVPGLDPNTAAAISSRAKRNQPHISIGWLVTEGLMSMEQLRAVGPYLTVGGDVVAGSSIGTIDGIRTHIASHFVVDATRVPARIIQMQDSLPFSLLSFERHHP
jgi:hypothetical protein